MSIKAILEMIPESNFLRIHRSFIVAKSQVVSFTKQDVMLKDLKSTVIPIGRLYAEQTYVALSSISI